MKNMTILFIFSKISLSLILLSMTIFLFYTINDSYSVENDNKRGNNFNIIATSDIGCSLRAQENIKNIEKLDPEIFLAVGDLSYKKNPNCWFDMTKSLDSKTKIAIGNHDAYEEEGEIGESLKQSLLDHYDLDKSYYSFDYQNVHVLVLNTQLELSVDTLESTSKVYATGEKGKDKSKKVSEPLVNRFPSIPIKDLFSQESVDIEIPQLDKIRVSNAEVPAIDVDEKQYQFVLDDLMKASQKENIDWIFVMFHKPMYSPLSKQFEEYIIRDKYQPLFDKYNVDLVISGHNHIYSRTLPLSFNKVDISQPIVDQNTISNKSTNSRSIFTDPNGTTFLVVGVGGAKLHRITEEQNYIATQYNKGFGFVDLNIDSKRLDGTFYDINLNCDTEITKKKGIEKIVYDTCAPVSKPTNSTKNLKAIDQFTIQKISQ